MEFHLTAVQTEDKDQTALFLRSHHVQLHLLDVRMEAFHHIAVLTEDLDRIVLFRRDQLQDPQPLLLVHSEVSRRTVAPTVELDQTV